MTKKNKDLEKKEESKFDELEDKLLELSAKEEEEQPNNETHTDLTEEDYESLKQKLLNEYDQNRNEEPMEKNIEHEEPTEENIEHEEPTEENIEHEEPIEENIEHEEPIEENIEHEEPIEKVDSKKINTDRYDLDDDDDIEIEEVSNSATDLKINQPADLTATQKNISPDVDQGLSKVAISKGSSMAMMVAMGAVLLFVVYKMLQPTPEELATQVKSEIDPNLPISKPVEDVGQTIVVPEIPKLPEVPTLSAPTPPPSLTPPPVMQLDIPSPPPPPPVVQEEVAKPATTVKDTSSAPVNVTNIFDPSASNASNDAAMKAAARKQAKINSSMLIGGGGGGGPSSKNLTSDGKSTTTLELNNSKIVATYIGELQRIIAQGKVIDAILETAINTDLPGSLRAIVSRDVYSEAGQNVLIPRGSRLIGTYNPTVAFGINRVQILWNRVIRPDGVDVAIASSGIDSLGRAGATGDVDNHVMRNLMTALMISSLDIAVATYLDKNGGSDTSGTTTTVTGGVTSTGSSDTGTIVSPTITTGTPPTNTEDASGQALENIGEVGKQLLGKTLAMPPTITIDQGTALKVYVQRDMIFPGRSANLTRIIE